MKALRKAIARYRYLWICDEASTEDSLAVFDTRGGRNLGCAVKNKDQLVDLVQMGAEWYLSSVHNGGKICRS